MNNLAYTSHDVAEIGQKVEEKIREEVGSQSPIPYQVEGGDAGEMSAGKFFGDIASGLLGGKSEVLVNLHFDFVEPRPAHLRLSMNRQGIGSHAGLLLYSTPLSKAVGGEIYLEDPKFFGKSKFKGDPAAERLNGNGDLVKLANELAKTESQSGGLTLKIKRFCKILPGENGGSQLVVATLPRPTKMGFSAAVSAPEFFELAQMVEATL
jgi:hypothetical protein